MSLPEFSRRLRALCARKASIAEVCRDTGLNRQQFNRYLAGETMPRADKLQMLARYFEVSVDDLVDVSRSFPAEALASKSMTPLDRLGREFAEMLSDAHATADLRMNPGFYCHFCWLKTFVFRRKRLQPFF